MKKPTAYATLDKLSKKGYIEVKTEQEGNRPPRKVYSINESGQQYFFELLIQNLSSADLVNYQGDIGLMFIDHLPLNKALPALNNRLIESEKIVQALKHTPSHGSGIGVNLAIQHKIIMLEAENSFLKQTVEKIKTQIDQENHS